MNRTATSLGLVSTGSLKVGLCTRGPRRAQRPVGRSGGHDRIGNVSARASSRHKLAGLERYVRQLAQEDPVCQRLMTMPGIGAVVALAFRSAVDDPARFTSSKKVALSWSGALLQPIRRA